MANRLATRPRLEEIEYPESDGKPMAETDTHRNLMSRFIEMLTQHFADRQPAYVSGNNFVYWEEGNPSACVSPDTYVVPGVPQAERNTYRAWLEGGRLPSVVIEFTSRKTRVEDVRKKRPIYEKTLRVPEYFQFDPTGDYLSPRLQGLRLIDGEYVPLELVDGRLRSEQLGLELVMQGSQLRLFDPAAGVFLRDQADERAARKAAEAAREAAEAAREAEARRRQDAETALEAALAELRKLREQRE
jgi:Uma2 family endonuclease